MSDPTAEITLPRVGGAALLAAPLLLLLGNLLRFGIATSDNAELLAEIGESRGRFYAGTVLLLLGVAVLVAAVLRMVTLARPRAEWWALGGGALAIFGLLAGSNILTVDIVRWLMTDSASDAAVTVTLADLADDSAGYTIAVLVPGLAFPIGLLVLAVALWRSQITPRWAPIVVAVGAVLFPIGRIPAIDPLLLITDLVLLVGLGALAVDTLRETITMPDGT